MKKSLLTLLLSLFVLTLLAQNDIVNITPLSPNAAEMSKYGEIPVNNFTGIPNIGIPLYTIKSGEIEIPIGLSYHAGGVKVEAIASWVGLSWSLTGLPSISRAVNSQPDEKGLGYFNMGKSIREYAAHYVSGYDVVLQELMSRVRDEGADTEPDVFSFNINGKSGKFYYSQDTHKFVTTPYSNVKIEFAQNFILTGEDGTKYFFEDLETTTVSGTTAGSPVTSSWMISKIISASGRDTVSFTYTTENQMTQSLIADVKHISLDGQGCVPLPPDVSGGLLTSISAKTLAAIHFKGGSVEFAKETTEREDLYGGYALRRMRIYDLQHRLIKQFGFNYKYLNGGGGGNGCVSVYYKSNKWMFLASLDQISNDGEILRHSFDYNELPIPPCRNSPAQDYWGYYNGATLNLNLIPTVSLPNNPTTLVPGADREVNPMFTQFGMLTKMSYPTGGYTSFEYENNDSQDEGLPKVYITESPYVAHEDPEEGGETLPSVGEYETTFVINNPSDLRLNNNHPEGGAFVSADLQNLGVPTGHYGALILIERISPSSPIVRLYPTSSFQNYYLPNGTYRLKATFDQTPANYQNFWVILSYDRIDTTQTNKYIGGLRVKRTQSYDQPTEVPLTTNYSYVESFGSSKSSGVSFLKPALNFSYVIPLGPENCPLYLMKIRSYSNQQQVTHSGSYVGYKTVFVQTDHPEKSGLTSFKYTSMRDEQENFFWPFPPAMSREEFRGQLEEKKEFRWTENGYLPIKSSSMLYINDLLDTPRLYALRTSSEQLFVVHHQNVNSAGEFAWPRFQPYEIALQWSALAKQTDRTYHPTDTTRFVETVTDFLYDTPYRQLTEKITTNSNGDVFKTKLQYPYNVSLSGDAEMARLWLLTKNNLSAVLKTETDLEGQLVKGQVSHYKKFDGLDLVRQSESISYGANPSENRKVFLNRYDNGSGNLLETYPEHGLKTTYLWSYNGVYPIAEIKNADYNTVVSALGGQSLVSSLAASAPTDLELSTIFSTLRNSPLLKNAQISTFTHQPLVGVKSMTDAKGMVAYYEYDGFQRLKTIKDHLGNIVKTYRYAYKNALAATVYRNVAASQTFIRNSCGVGFTGGQVVYTVPASVYSSTVSQAEADALAAVDIANNGQNFANANGSCIPAQTCTLFKITIPVSSSSNLYVRYKECGSNTYTLLPLEEFPQDEGDGVIVGTVLCVNGTSSDFTFQYGLSGPAQVFFGTMIENLGSCF